MQRFLIVLVLVVACIVGLGFYQKWFQFGTTSSDGKTDMTLSVNKEKFQEDKKKAEEEAAKLGHQVKDKVTPAAEKTTEGILVSVKENQLTMTNKEGKEQGQTLAANVKVTCDGKDCKASDLKPGMRLRVTAEKAEPHAAIRIEALDGKAEFEKGA